MDGFRKLLVGDSGGIITVRDPLWNTINLDGAARRIVDLPAFQRLRHIKQLGHAHLVYPGATHTRFDHALGVYHLTRRALSLLEEHGEASALDPVDCGLVTLAGLLHDIGHYPFSHALEELDSEWLPGHHEALACRFLAAPELCEVLDQVAGDGAVRVQALVRGNSTSPLQGLVSGSLDLDKIEYLKRDAHFCGVPYGEVDVDRLLHSLRVLPDPESGRPEVGVDEKGVAALESLLFAKYQMFRNVYWHHAVRSATVLYKRIVVEALRAELLAPDELIGETDEGLLNLLERRIGGGSALDRRLTVWLGALRARVLPKRGGEVVAGELEGGSSGAWMAIDSSLKRKVEESIAAELELEPGAVFLDFPEKPAMFGLDLLVRRRSGEVLRLGPHGRAGLIGLPSIAEQLYRSARVLRLFTLGRRVRVEPGALARLGAWSAQEVASQLDDGARLLT